MLGIQILCGMSYTGKGKGKTEKELDKEWEVKGLLTDSDSIKLYGVGGRDSKQDGLLRVTE